jgi:hypothetical protein
VEGRKLLMDLVVVPLWQRAGFAEACLLRLAKAMDSSVRVRLCLDFGYSADVLKTTEAFAKKFPDTEIFTREEDYPTGSYNVLKGMAEALHDSQPDDLIHVLEEDILIGRDFFDFHRRAHALVPDAYGVSACTNSFLTRETNPEPVQDAVYRSGGFQVWGSSYRPDRVRQILTRLQVDYFENMHEACVREFGESSALRTGPLYDGVMAMNLAETKKAMVFPYAARAYHAGFEGLSFQGQGPAVTGTPKQQAKQILAMGEKELSERSTYPNAWFPVVDLDAVRAPVTRVLDF